MNLNYFIDFIYQKRSRSRLSIQFQKLKSNAPCKKSISILKETKNIIDIIYHSTRDDSFSCKATFEENKNGLSVHY